MIASAAFDDWLAALKTRVYTDGRSIRSTHDDRPNNWGTHAGASRIAIDIYTDDTADLDDAAEVFHGYLGDRSVYAGFSYGTLEWQDDQNAPVGINPLDAEKTISGALRDIDGVVPDDIPVVTLHTAGEGMPVTQLCKQAGLTESTSEALRLIAQGGLKLDGERVSEKGLRVPAGATVLVQAGKRRFARVALT